MLHGKLRIFIMGIFLGIACRRARVGTIMMNKGNLTFHSHPADLDIGMYTRSSLIYGFVVRGRLAFEKTGF